MPGTPPDIVRDLTITSVVVAQLATDAFEARWVGLSGCTDPVGTGTTLRDAVRNLVGDDAIAATISEDHIDLRVDPRLEGR